MGQGRAEARAIRKKLHFSQSGFADAFGLSVDAGRHWESGRRSPEAAARSLLLVIAHDPQVVLRALRQAEPQVANPNRAGKALPRRIKAASSDRRGSSASSKSVSA